VFEGIELCSKFVKEDMNYKIQILLEEIGKSIQDYDYNIQNPLINLKFHTKSQILLNTAKYYNENTEKDEKDEIIISQKIGIGTMKQYNSL